MVLLRPLLCLSFFTIIYCLCACTYFYNYDENKFPTVGISILVRNKEHSLPYFLTCLRRLKYPKDRMYLWIYSDYSRDKSDEIIEDWVKKHKHEYGAVYITMHSNHSGYEYPEEIGGNHWSQSHFEHVIDLRDQALAFGRKMWADYLLMIDADAFLTNPNTLNALVRKELEICAPMLQSDDLYSNFWCAMTNQYYYQRTDEYRRILDREEKGCHPVPMVHTCVLINLKLKKSDWLTYDPKKAINYDGPIDDIITFAVNAKNIGMTLQVCNDEFYGYTPIPPDEKNSLDVEKQNLVNLKMDAINIDNPLPLDPELELYVQYPVTGNYGLDAIFVINLERRPKRRRLMQLSLKELGLSYKFFKAIDGKELTPDVINKLGIHPMEKYEDPYQNRPIKVGEIGCFLSHYYIWKQVAENQYDNVLILEDDVSFVPNFKEEIKKLLKDVSYLPDWDLVYLGRKILYDGESYISNNLVKPRYSYWTLGYFINARGAQKLLDAKPLEKLIPVDEFIPIMFDEHPNTTWKSQFEDRNLIAFSASPLLIHPTHYTGQEGYISDTEGSMIHSTPPINPMQHDKQKPKRVILGTFIGFKEEDDSLNIESRFVDPENTPDSWSESLTQKFYKTEL